MYRRWLSALLGMLIIGASLVAVSDKIRKKKYKYHDNFFIYFLKIYYDFSNLKNILFLLIFLSFMN